MSVYQPPSFIQTTGDGATVAYSVPFPYIDRTHVFVSVNGTPVPFTWVNASLIQLATAPGIGAIVRRYRKTPSGVPLVDFNAGAALQDEDLDLAVLQALYVAREAEDQIGQALVDGVAAAASATSAAASATSAAASATSAATFNPSQYVRVDGVKRYGAVGNGLSFDRGAFASALAVDKPVVVPPGTYNIESPLAMTDADTLIMRQGASFTGTQPTGGVRIYDLARAIPIAGSKMKIEKLWERADTRKLEDIAGIWPGQVGTFFGVSREFDASYVTGTASPANAMFTYAANVGSNADVVASMSVAFSWANNKTVFGANIIAGSAPGVTGAKLVGAEIDIEPSIAGAPAAGSGGLYINTFNLAVPGPAIQIGYVSGGTFNNGIIIDGVAGAGVAGNSGAIMQSLINSAPASYTQDAIILGNQHKVRFNSSGGSPVSVGCDTGNNLTITGAGALITARSSTSEGTPLVSVRDGSGVEAVSIYVARGSPPNAAGSALKINGQSVTSRSISAGGTINASGADYAEYEYRREDCRAFAKGDIVGFDADGLLTDRYDLALAFGVKSTNPNLVGGDTWAENVGPRPVEPVYVDPDIPRPPAPDFKGCDGLESNERQAAFDKALTEYEAALAAHRTAWEAREMVPYRAALAAFEAELEKARQRVERIAYCGKCPVNVTGAKPGDWIVPARAEDGSITAYIANNSGLSFEMFRVAVGQVRRILPDGRAEIAVGVR